MGCSWHWQHQKSSVMQFFELEKEINYTLDNDDDVRLLLLSLGMPGGLPNPKVACKTNRCGYTLFAKETESHYISIWRHCNCEKVENGNYSAMMLSKKLNTRQQANDIQMEIMKHIGTNFSEMIEVSAVSPKLN